MAKEHLRKLGSHLTNVALIALLLGAAYWGHHNHWRIPSFASLIGQSEKIPPRVNGDSVTLATEPARPGEYSIITLQSPEAAREIGIESTPVVQRQLDVFVQANAVVGYDQTRTAQLSARASGFVWSVHTRLGQFVRKGDLLAIIDSQEVGQAKADLLQETAAANFKDRQLERIQAAERGVVADRVVREMEAAAVEGRVRKFNAQQRLINMGLDFDFQQLKDIDTQQLDRRIQFLGIPENVLALMNPRPKTANLLPLRAPFDGFITHLEIVVGERVTPDHPPVVMADVRRMWIKLSIRKEDADRLALGQKVLFATDGVSHAAEGKLTWISTAIDEKTHTVEARAEVDNPLLAPVDAEAGEGPRTLRVNEFGGARVLIDMIPRALLVPEKAIQRLMDQTPLVFVECPDHRSFQPRKVRLGRTESGFVHVQLGVQPGDRVVTAQSYVLKSELMKDTLAVEN